VRHLDLVQWRFKGDRATALRYVPEARKYLGIYMNMLAAGGVQTGARTLTHKLGEGVTFRVITSFGNVPIAEIDTTAITGSVEKEVIEGFVVRPGPETTETTNTPDSFVLLDPARGWAAYFYQQSDLPSHPDFPVGLQKSDSQGRALFINGDLNGLPQQNGLMFFGNIDWRNKDESVICSWWGPTARYFGNLNDPSPYLFCHGQILLDVSTMLPAGFFGDTTVYLPGDYGGRTGVVIGACVRNVPGFDACALVVVRFGPKNGGIRKEFLIRVSIVSDDPRGRPEKLEQSAWFKIKPAVGDVPAGNPEVLWSRDVDLRDATHPWCFNQSGTQARAIRYDDDIAGSGANPLAVECALTVDDAGVWSYAETPNSGGLATTTTSLTGTQMCFGMQEFHPSWFVNSSTAYDATTSDFISASNTGIASWPVASSLGNLPLTGLRSTTISSDADLLVCAVDFRDDEPVYAYAYMPNNTRTNTTTNTNDVVGSGSASGPAYATTGDVVGHAEGGGTHAWSTESTKSGIVNGLKTDWIDVQATTSETGTSSGEANLSYSEDGSTTFYWVVNTFPPGGGAHDGWTTGWYGDPDVEASFYGIAIPASGDPDGFGAVSTETGTTDATGSNSLTTVDETLEVIYLDLRYKWFVYQMTTVTQTSTESATGSAALPLPGGGGATITLTGPAESSLTTTKAYTTKLNDEVLAESEVTDTSTSSTTASFGPYFTKWAVMNVYPCFLGEFPTASIDGNTSPHAMTPTGSVTTSIVSPNIRFWSDLTWEVTDDAVGLDGGFMTQGMYGSWQTYKKAWLFCQAMPTGDGTDAHYVFKGSGDPNIKKRTNTEFDSAIVRFHPIWVLPRVTY